MSVKKIDIVKRTISKENKILIVGLGLLGGSYAMALTKAGYSVSALTRSPETIQYALQAGMIEKGDTKIDGNLIGEADIVIFGLYPTTLLDWIAANQQYFKPGALLTDVTGVKSSIVPKIQDMLREDVEFIGCHPMAGKESSGVKNSDPEIFKPANFIITPTERNTKEAVETCYELAEILGFTRVSELSIQEHDEMIGFLSQLTHVIAVSLMTCNDSQELVKYTGDSFRDLTRIAKINEKMWSELFLLNKEELLSQIDRFSGELTAFRNMLAEEDRAGMEEKMKLSTQRRHQFD